MIRTMKSAQKSSASHETGAGLRTLHLVSTLGWNGDLEVMIGELRTVACGRGVGKRRDLFHSSSIVDASSVPRARWSICTDSPFGHDPILTTIRP